MANFEGLINQALASQNAADPAVRQRIYQSSRNALAKMLEKKGDLSDDVLRRHFGQLEDSIASIEAGYNEPEQQSVAPEPDTVPVAKPADPVPPAPTAQEASTSPPTAPQPHQDSLEKPVRVEPAAPIAEPEPTKTPRVDPVVEQPPEPPIIRPEAYEPQPLFPPVQQTPAQSKQAAAPATNQPEPTVSANIAQATDPLADLEARLSLDNSQTAQTTARSPQEPLIDKPAEPYLGDVRTDIDAPQQYVPNYDEQDFEVERDLPPTYKRKNPLLRRIWPIFLAIAVLLVILWILYALFAIMPENGDQTDATASPTAGESLQNEDGSFFITLLEPTDLSALVTAGRGSAELVTQQAKQMLRLQSIRQGELTASNAEPILLELEKGVLQQIKGKEVTVELNAKSGLAGPAQFAVECDIGGDSVCGRKRFRVGLQPELIVFALDLKGTIQTNASAFLAISTDITNAADASGKGDAIDINFVRLRVSNPGN